MAKRGPTSELNHENWDREDTPEVPGTFQRASNDIIQRRVIKTAKRRSTGLSDQGETKNVFSAFQGFQSDSSAKPASNLSATFSFLKNSSTSSANGIVNPSQPSMNIAVSSSTNNSCAPGSTAAAATQSSKMNSSGDESGGDKYPAKLIRLNQCVAEWIKSHVDKDPSCILTPVFRDYERYLKEIEAERNRSMTSKKDSGSSAENNLISSSNISASSNFKFVQSNDNTGNVSSNTENDKKLSSFSSPASGSSTSSSNTIFSSFKSDNRSANKSSLLAKPDPASAMVNPFTTSLKKIQEDKMKVGGEPNKSTPDSVFKLSQDSSTPATAGFSFGTGSGKMFPFGGAGTGTLGLSSSETTKKDNDNDGDEESDEPPKPDFTPVKEQDAVYNQRCKVFIKKETSYAELGVGTLYIKPVAGEKHQLIVRADTSLGNILVNVLLTSAIPTQRIGKNNVMMVCIPTPPPAGSSKQPEPSTVLLRVKTTAEADDLLKVLEKFKKQISN